MPNGAQIVLTGHVQGVGFRPFVYRLAHQHKLTGYVQNRLGEVDIVACGSPESLQKFREELIEQAPPLARPRIVRAELVDSVSFTDFNIVASTADANARVFVPADHFMCDDCRRELNDPTNRRYRYPFINCTQCGPRYTLIESLPYDRENTSMAGFELCADCRAEYENPMDRRFHAEPIACPVCGPGLNFEKGAHLEYSDADTELELAVSELRSGGIVAVKGIGGYHLMCDARNAVAVAKLRLRKHRPDKPFAVMFPMRGADGLDAVQNAVQIAPDEAQRLLSPSRPIMLLRKRKNPGVADNIAPGLNEIGVFLPYSPLHHLLLSDFAGPLVATSGNISGEPVLTDNDEALSRLEHIADAFLHHDRPIVRPADDPVCRKIAGSIRPIRMGRGSAPCEMELPWRLTQPLLAVGGHMKGTLALAWDKRAVVSPHIGEMDNARSFDVFEQLVVDLQALYQVRVERIVSDAHPGYTTHRWAKRSGLPFSTVFHHQAHASALAAEIDATAQWLTFTWDGVGFGEDGSLWGGEALLGQPGSWDRFASLRPFRLPGGNLCGRAPWRSAAALHWECGEAWHPQADTDGLAEAAWRSGLNSPASSAAGRLFDAAAAIICAQPNVSYEAQGPMLLESLCHVSRPPIDLPLAADDSGVFRSDWSPLLPMLKDGSRPAEQRAEVFHASLATAILEQAKLARSMHNIDRVGLTGGVFQNQFLTSLTVELLTKNSFDVHLPLQLPCNDAALSFGQVAEIAARDVMGKGNG
jgi:hydrogenase maturation protein HypF